MNETRRGHGARAAMNSASSPGASAAAAGSTRYWCARLSRPSTASTAIALTKLDVLDGLDDDSRSAPAIALDGEMLSITCRQARALQAPCRTGLRDAGRVERHHCRRAQLERSSGPGGQICPIHRGVDRRAGRPPLHQPGTGRHDTCDRSVSRLVSEAFPGIAADLRGPARKQKYRSTEAWQILLLF